MRSRTMVVAILIVLLGTILSFYGDSDRVAARAFAAETTLISRSSGGVPGDGYSLTPFITANGRYVAFASDSGNLVPGDTNGGARHLRPRSADGDHAGSRRYRRDAGEWCLTHPASRPTVATWRSCRMPATWCRETPMTTTDIFVHDRQTGTTTRVRVSPTGRRRMMPSISPSQRRRSLRGVRVVLPATWCRGTPTAPTDIFVYDRRRGRSSG